MRVVHLFFIFFLFSPSMISCQCDAEWFGRNCSETNLCDLNGTNLCPDGFSCQVHGENQECKSRKRREGKIDRWRLAFRFGHGHVRRQQQQFDRHADLLGHREDFQRIGFSSSCSSSTGASSDDEESLHFALLLALPLRWRFDLSRFDFNHRFDHRAEQRDVRSVERFSSVLVGFFHLDDQPFVHLHDQFIVETSSHADGSNANVRWKWLSRLFGRRSTGRKSLFAVLSNR